MKRYAALIPVYKERFDADESACVARYLEVLTEGGIRFFLPEHLDSSWYEQQYPGVGYERFADRYFKGIGGYNRLLLSDQFYARFTEYEYILIAQPDAVIWQDRDRIGEFIAKGYDYYGAPWQPERRIWEWTFPRLAHFPYRGIRCHKRTGNGLTMGNGGFSLRRVAACRALIAQYRWRKLYWFWKRNEDIFFGLCGSDNKNEFRLADLATGEEFAREYRLRECVETGDIPYAVHGWSKDYRDYEEMRAHLAAYGYRI